MRAILHLFTSHLLISLNTELAHTSLLLRQWRERPEEKRNRGRTSTSAGPQDEEDDDDDDDEVEDGDDDDDDRLDWSSWKDCKGERGDSSTGYNTGQGGSSSSSSYGRPKR